MTLPTAVAATSGSQSESNNPFMESLKESCSYQHAISIVLKVRSKEEVKSVYCMVMMIRNTCRMFGNLFQLVGNRGMKSLNSLNISVSGLEPVSVEYIEVSNIKNFNLWLYSQQRLMAGSKILKEGEKVSSIRGAIAKTKSNSSCREIYS